MNPLIDFPQTPFGSLAFDAIEPAYFMPAAEHWMNVARERISAITENTDAPSFSNTLVPLEFASKELGVVSSCFFNLNSAETNEDIQTIARELSPKLTLFNNETLLNEALFVRIKTVGRIESRSNWIQKVLGYSKRPTRVLCAMAPCLKGSSANR